MRQVDYNVLLPVSSQGYDDGYGGEYDDESYEAYEDNYSTQSKRCAYTHANKSFSVIQHVFNYHYLCIYCKLQKWFSAQGTPREWID